MHGIKRPNYIQTSDCHANLLRMRSDKFIFGGNCMIFLPSTFQCLCFWKVPQHFLEIWLKLCPVWKREKEGWVRKTQILTNLKATNCCEVTPIEKLIYFTVEPYKLRNIRPVWKFGLCNRGIWGEYTPYRYSPFVFQTGSGQMSSFCIHNL